MIAYLHQRIVVELKALVVLYELDESRRNTDALLSSHYNEVNEDGVDVNDIDEGHYLSANLRRRHAERILREVETLLAPFPTQEKSDAAK